MVLVQKWPIFQLFFFYVFDDILEQKNPWFWSKKGHFSNFFSLANLGQENVFYNIVERETTF